ncbi:MAG: phage/plasmid primase, P4 family [Hyphomicrobiaceae bacterium]
MTDDSENGLVGKPTELFETDMLGLFQQLIPLGKWDATAAGGLALGKVPTLTSWQNGPPPGFDPPAHLLKGCNVGIVLLDGDCVLDEDPRNFPAGYAPDYSPARQLLAECGMDAKACPTVKTGGGGFHYYIRIPEGLAVVGSLRGLRGLDVKGPGSQVVAAGSRHPGTGLIYEWLTPTPSERPMSTDALVARLMRTTAQSSSSSTTTSSSTRHTPQELAAMLRGLDATSYRDQERWLRLMMACHAATGGEDVEEFIDFSTSDPMYRSHADRIMARWRSLSANKTGAVTERTLYRELIDAGKRDLIPNDASADFEHDPLPDAAPVAAPVARARATIAPAASPATAEAGLLPRPFPKGDHRGMARALLAGTSLQYWRGDWYEHRASHYVRLGPGKFRSMVWEWAEEQEHAASNGTEQVRPNKQLVDNIEEAAQGLALLECDAPCWLERLPGDPDARRLVPMLNGILDLDGRRLLPHTERLFVIHALPFGFDPNARAPKWMAFLASVWGDDVETLETLQMYTGLTASGRTDLQKILFVFGPTRSGKGVIQSVFQGLLGSDNCCGPTLDDLGGDFGLEPLIGKSLAIFSDVRLGTRTSSQKVLGNLLRISGEDQVSANRKYKLPWVGVLPTRLMMFSNDIPNIRDTSTALQARLVVLRMTRSFKGQEDTGLKGVLVAELPGILNWALEGLVKLEERGRLVQPQSGQQIMETMRAAASPVGAFLEQRCVLGEEHEVPKEDLFKAFKHWRDAQEIPYHSGISHFMRDVFSAASGVIEESKERKDGGRRRVLKGVGLLPEDPLELLEYGD